MPIVTPACRIFKQGVWMECTADDATTGGVMAGVEPLARCVRVRSVAFRTVMLHRCWRPLHTRASIFTLHSVRFAGV
eukprot:261547-Prymnesium_polylepis.1